MNALAEVIGTLRPQRGDRHGPLMPLLVLLTCLTGVVDAVSYLKFGHVFVANMTGNIVFLGFAIAGAGGLSAITSLVAIGSFLVGAALSGYLGARTGAHRGRLLRAACILQFTLILAATIVALAVGEPLSSATRYALLVPLALAMGVQNAAAQRLAVPELTTTVLTRTLTGLASEASFLGGPGAKPGRRGLAVSAMLLGAIAGAALVLKVSIVAPLALAAVIVLAVGIAAHVVSRRPAPWLDP